MTCVSWLSVTVMHAGDNPLINSKRVVWLVDWEVLVRGLLALLLLGALSGWGHVK